MEPEERAGAGSTRDQLILAGLEELNEHGIQNFSTRRVAQEMRRFLRRAVQTL